MDEHALEVRTIADSGTLCRVIGVFAQLGLCPPELEVSRDGTDLVIRVRTKADVQTVARLERKWLSIYGVKKIEITQVANALKQA